ncbi:NUDIX hydrolase [Corynebacterium sp. 32222D000AT]|uniref:NUDIX hydrolase n=1 Tax=unclassified Corynebacterium TaxID=2624378 RepID=UPI002A97A9B3|nr:NUDIX domain-containing protein [Mycobacteriaceae bacterium]MDY5829071.1 NUDIX domain-containing protein [Corynebacterium sp.]
MIEVAAIVIRNPQGHVLTVRKKSSTKYQLPGGKLEEGEALVDAALREVSEEVGLHLDAENLDKLGTFDAPAANEPGETVVGTIFTCTHTVTNDEPHAAAEIGDIAWVNPAAPDRDLAHLLRDRVFPALN